MARKKNIAAALRRRNLNNSETRSIEKKGMELPINTLVIVAIAVIVILAIAAFFMGGFGRTSQNLQAQQDFKNSCSAWTQTGCAGSAPVGLEEKFFKWQPDKQDELSQIDDKTDYLAGMCGCFGRGTPPRTGGTCSDYGVSNCPISTADKCKLKYTSCIGVNGNCDSACTDTTKYSGREASMSYNCKTAPNTKCCILKDKVEFPNACISK